jgi:hypothetical protein
MVPAIHDGPPSPEDYEIGQSNFMVGELFLMDGFQKVNPCPRAHFSGQIKEQREPEKGK